MTELPFNCPQAQSTSIVQVPHKSWWVAEHRQVAQEAACPVGRARVPLELPGALACAAGAPAAVFLR